MLLHLAFKISAGELNLGLHAYKESTLLMEPSLQPSRCLQSKGDQKGREHRFSVLDRPGPHKRLLSIQTYSFGFEIQFHGVQDDLELTVQPKMTEFLIMLPLPSELWDYRHAYSTPCMWCWGLNSELYVG